MATHVAVLGIDGSGKSTVAGALPLLLAAECGVVAGGAGEDFRVVAPDEDRLAPGFHPQGLPLSARLAKSLKRRAKEAVDDRRRYPLYKLAQMLFQDAAARALDRRYGPAVVVSDGNTLLSAIGRAANYRRPASKGEDAADVRPDVDDLVAVLRFVLDDEPLPEASARKLPRLGPARIIKRFARLLGLDAVWLPDVVVFLDLSPGKALERIARRGAGVDPHENEEDLAQARRMYQRGLEAYRRYRPQAVVVTVAADDLTPGAVLEKVLAGLRARVAPGARPEPAGVPLGTTRDDLSAAGLSRKVLSPRYLGYLVAKCFQGAWREPLFALSRPGRLFLREGYSANVMRAIYDASPAAGPVERAFLEYPLHRAVHDRLPILAERISRELETRLRTKPSLSILTAPSGFAYDLFRPLEAIASKDPALTRRVRLLASDLDPHRSLEGELGARARALGIELDFVRGDLTSDETRTRLARGAPFDIALFVGLSAWLPKPALVRHARFVREHLSRDGVLVSDSFTAAAYALSGRYVGYRASYYEPSAYRALLDYCGFDGAGASPASGPDRINHVMLFRPRA